MASFWDGLLGGSDPSALYGDIFTPQQKQALQYRQMTDTLGELAAGFGRAAMPSPVKLGLGAVLGSAAGGLGANQDKAVERVLTGGLTAEKIKEARRMAAWRAKFEPLLWAEYQRTMGGQDGTPPTAPGPPGAVSPGPPGTVPPGPPGTVPPGPPEAVPPVQSLPGIKDLGPPAFGGGGLLAQGPPGGVAAAAGMSPEMLSLAGGTAGPGWGLPPEAAPPGPQPPAPGRQTGLLPSPDQLVGQGGPGILGGAMMPASYGGGPATAPLPFRQVSGGGPPGAGGADLNDRSDASWEAVKPLIKRFESDNRNVEQGVVPPGGGYNPSVGRVTGPSSASGYFQMIDSTYRDAARKTGIDVERYPRAIDLPERLQEEVAKTLYKEQGLSPWAPYNKPLAQAVGWRGGGGQDVVLPREGGPRLTRDMLTNAQYSPGAQYVPPGGGLNDPIPGLGMSPKQISLLDAMAEMAGMKTPFKELLDSYYKTPGYVAEVERTRTQAQKDIELKMDPLILEQRKRAEYKVDMELKPELDAAVARLQSPILKEREQAKADIDRVTKQMELAGAAALRPNDATVVGPGGVLTTQKITDLEFAQRQKAKADRIARGDTTMQPGDIVGTPIGAAPAEHQYIMTPQGSISAAPVPGTPAAEKAAEAANKKLQTEHQKMIGRDIVVREVDNIGKLMDDAIFPTTGFVGSIMQNLAGTSANDVRVARQTLESRLSTDAINAQRAASPTGAAFGNTSDTDMAILRTALVNLDQSQTKQQFKDRLQILKQAYVDAVHGPGMSRLLPETQVLKTPEPTRGWKEGDITDYPDGSQQQLRNGTWVETRPPRK